jgi:hypothetical protein
MKSRWRSARSVGCLAASRLVWAVRSVVYSTQICFSAPLLLTHPGARTFMPGTCAGRGMGLAGRTLPTIEDSGKRNSVDIE